MLKTRDSISKFFTKECSKFLTNREKVQEYADILLSKYDLPYAISIDLLTLKTSVLDTTDNIIFFIISVINNKELSTFFSEREIKKYSSTKYKAKRISFPLRFDVIKINELQYNGVIYSKQLMELRDSQMINYNENTQRPVKHKVYGNVEYYVQDINRRSVEQISELMKKGEYIPDQITLNLPEEVDWYYDEEEKQLVVKSAECFDITDGNHRYVAMSNLFNIDKSFDYPMELRITCFNEDKANQFMYQVDQKNKLNKVDLELKNSNNPANRMVMMLNDSRELKGMFSRDKSKIDPGVFAALSTFFYFNNKKKYNQSEIVIIKKNIQIKLSAVLDSAPELYEKKWSNAFLLCVLFFCNKDVSDDKIYDKAQKLYNKIEKENKLNLFEKRDFGKTDITRLEKIYSE